MKLSIYAFTSLLAAGIASAALNPGVASALPSGCTLGSSSVVCDTAKQCADARNELKGQHPQISYCSNQQPDKDRWEYVHIATWY
ncbi:hypothetical protein ACIBCN_32810 [Nocardia sp. NPDC051052]|uniref:hypothetical protein n=1 Tax=Nocardia sp. NPDC051052 TaxID=3364322 RepID=UPI00378B6A00